MFVCGDCVLVGNSPGFVPAAGGAVGVNPNGPQLGSISTIPSTTTAIAAPTTNIIGLRTVGAALFFGSCISLISTSSPDQDARMPEFTN